ncbi:DUF47 family protein [Kribbella sp. NBC_00482]|uniref:DUF47 domain-containing protein n=1 Tax=Kribbella sp. NBC_00482 TaxID=2975968 RepID=UPI002E17B37F
MRIRRLYGDLTGRAHHRILDALDAQLRAVIEGVEVVGRMTTGELSPADARSAMADVEHDGDALRAALVGELAVALTTPIDREDLYRLSRSIDDVLDNLRDLVRETDLYDAKPEPADIETLAMVSNGLGLLRQAIGSLLRRPSEVTLSTLAVRKCAGRVRQQYQAAVAELFRLPVSIELLKRRELLRRLDVVGLRLGECADALSDAMLKRSH